MKTKVFIAIGIRIIVLFVLGMMATFLPDYLREFFGDTLHDCSLSCVNWCHNRNEPDKLWDWGARHYWYSIMMITLFVLASANFVLSIVNVVKKNYDTSSW